MRTSIIPPARRAAAGRSVLIGALAAVFLAVPNVHVARAASRTAFESGDSDLVVSGQADIGRYDLFVARRTAHWTWRPLAAIPTANPDDLAIGQQCVTGDARYAIVVVAPRSATNDPRLMDAGGVAYAVALDSGQMTLLARGVTLAYFDPGCGVGEQYALTSYLGGDEADSRVVVGDLSRQTRWSATYAGELTSAVPVGPGAVAVSGNHLDELGTRGTKPLAALGGPAYDLRPAADGGVDFLVDTGATTAVMHLQRGNVTELGAGAASRVGIAYGLHGSNHFENILPRAGVRLDPARVPGEVSHAAVSSAGDAVLAAGRAGPSAAIGPVDSARESLTLIGRPPSSTRVGSRPPRILSAVARSAARRAPRSAAPAMQTQTPTCAVPRGASGLYSPGIPNVPDIQVTQPSAPMMDWALQLASRNKLTGTNARPQGFDNLRLPSYAASTDFPVPALLGSTSGHVPPQVMEGILATESNWKQASFHAPRGMAGDPLTANYYGTDANGDYIDYAAGDCGYGAAQVTSLMGVGQESPRPPGQDRRRLRGEHRGRRADPGQAVEPALPRRHHGQRRQSQCVGRLVPGRVGIQHGPGAQRRAREHHRLHARTQLYWAGRNLGPRVGQ